MQYKTKLEKTQWFADARYGFLFHFLNPHNTSPEHPNQDFPHDIQRWNEEVESFNVDLFARQLAELHAGYAYITVGQNSGYYCSPSKTFDGIMGEERSSRRDLVADFADALAKYDIPCLVYTTGLAPYFDRDSVAKLACVPPWHTMNCNTYYRYLDLVGKDPRLVEYQLKWNAIHREWAERWEKKIKGWWVDGIHSREMFDHADEPNGQSFVNALRAGNPDAIVAFNAGCVVEPGADRVELEDYTAGEMNTPEFCNAAGPLVDGLRYHLLTFAGAAWWTEGFRFTAEEMAGITRKVNDNEGVLTWDVPFDAAHGIREHDFKILKDFVSLYEKSYTLFPKTFCAVTPPRVTADSAPVNGKALLRSPELSGMEIEWNGKTLLCPEGKEEWELELAPVQPACDLKLKKGGLERSFPLTTVPEFRLSAAPTAPFELYSHDGEKLLASYTFALRDSKLIVDGTIFETELNVPEDVTRLCASSRCSCADIFFSFDHVKKSEIHLRPDCHNFHIEEGILTEIKDMTAIYSPLENGKYTCHLEIPLTHLPEGNAQAGAFYMNIAQHTTWHGEHISGMLFGGRNKVYAAHYDSAFFIVGE